MKIPKLNHLLGALILGAALSAPAATPLMTEHVDIGIAWIPTNTGSARWDLHVHDESNDIEYEPGNALLYVRNLAYTNAPNTANLTNILGAPGASVWILPAIQNTNLLYLGLGAEEVTNTLFQGDQFKMTLTAFTGPGQFAMYSVDGFGIPTAHFNTRDGLSLADQLILAAEGHSDFNWAFSAPGDYTLTFQASGTLVAGSEVTTSDSVDYFFHVEAVPEPGTTALLALGGIAVFALMQRRRRL